LSHLLTRLLVAGTMLAAIGAEPAAAGTFHVYGLGMNGAGCPNGWQAQSSPPSRFRQHNYCSTWDIKSVRDGTALKRGQSAGTSMYTAAGARFTGFSIRSRGTARNGTSWNAFMCQTPFRDCAGYFSRSGTWSESESALGTLLGGSPFYAQHLWAGVTCNQDKCPDSTSAGRAVNVTHLQSHAVVEDYTAPGKPSVGGISSGWNSGEKQLTYYATDAGSGVATVQLTVDGSLNRTVNHSCSRLPTGGYTQPVPCATAAGGEFSVNEPGQLADGHHSVSVTSRDAGGATAWTTRDLWVDNNAPGHPIGLSVTGGDGWRRTNDFSVTWENPEQGNGSEIVAAYYKIGSAPDTPKDGFRLNSPAARADLEAPRDGTWPVYVWLEDAAGNALPSTASVVHLRLDSTPPALAFANERAVQNPAEVRVRTADAHSGVASGQIEIRRRGVPEWRELETRREGTDLVTTIPDDQLERGTYELRAFASDAVGNTAVTTRRADGQAMVVGLPLRSDTTLGASLSRRAGGARGGRRAIRIRYRRHAWLRGVLRSGGALLADTRVFIETRRLRRGKWSPLTEVVTDGNGRYSVRLPRGVSREVRVRFAGNRSLQPASDVVRLLVRGSATLRLSPRSLSRGGTITFLGHVGLFRAHLPEAGKLIQIQYLDGHKWRPAVKLGHTSRRGRFAIRYRFRRISRPTKIYFRILVPAEGGWPYATGASRVRTAFVRP
jgi:hypothetical protein